MNADDHRVREKAAKVRAEAETSRLAGALRAKAQAVFDQQHRGSRTAPRGQDRLIADLPNGYDSVLRVAWSTFGPKTTFTVRGWMQSPDGGLVPMAGFGLHLNVAQLPSFAAAVSAALDDVEPGKWGLRVNETTPASLAGEPPEIANEHTNGDNS